MKVSMSYSTRKLIILNQIRGYNNEHLIDNIEFTIPNELSGFNIGLLFAQDDHTPIGAVSLALAWTSGMLTYSVPNGLTIYRRIEFQIVAAHPTDGRVWKSQIGYFYFDEPLPDHSDMPFTELSPYPDWIAAIEAALAAADAANEATLVVNGVVADAEQAILDIAETEAIIIANEATRQEIYNNLLAVNGIVYISNGNIRSATKEDIDADTVDGLHASELSLAPYIHEQLFFSSIWTITHNRNSYPSATLVDETNSTFYGSITYPDLNTIQIVLSKPMIGKAYVI